MFTNENFDFLVVLCLSQIIRSSFFKPQCFQSTFLVINRTKMLKKMEFIVMEFNNFF